MAEGIRRAIIRPVITGTASRQGEMVKVLASESLKASICAACPPECENPATAKMTRVMSIEGTVVIII